LTQNWKPFAISCRISLKKIYLGHTQISNRKRNLIRKSVVRYHIICKACTCVSFIIVGWKWERKREKW